MVAVFMDHRVHVGRTQRHVDIGHLSLTLYRAQYMYITSAYSRHHTLDHKQ